MSTPPRRLKLLNEVLPTPSKANQRSAAATASPASPGTSPRDRTLSHMQRLLSTAALAVACSKTAAPEPPGYGVVDPMPIPSRDRDDAGPPPPAVSVNVPDAGAGPEGAPSAAASAAPSAKKPPHKPPRVDPPGYGVVDPLPPPPPSVKPKPPSK